MTTLPRLIPVFFLILIASAAVHAESNAKKSWDDPEAASKDADFAVQGEYAGQVKEGNETLKMGVQVIALGDGKFRGVNYRGGLPGDGHDAKLGKAEAESKTTDAGIEFAGPKYRGLLKDGVITIFDVASGNEIGKLQRVVRESPTLGAKPPEGAVVLFDGKTNRFKEGDKKVTKDGLLMQGVTSEQTFGDFTLHIEFRLPYKPGARGQARGNSGIYLQGRYEVQMLDSFGLAGRDNECGGLYSIKAPDLNMCFPPLQWQTYDIEFTAARYDDAGKKTANARLTVRHNGVVIHKDVELPKSTTAAPKGEGADKGPIHLQDHGNPVVYRNVWIVER